MPPHKLKYEGFSKLLGDWHKAVGHLSITTQRKKHPNRIVLLRLLSDTNSEKYFSYLALQLVTAKHTIESLGLLYETVPKVIHPPIPDYYRGNVTHLRECWTHWAVKTKLIKKVVLDGKYVYQSCYDEKAIEQVHL